ncbi:hypothetical protein [Thermoflexus sp.]|uniref:hypothetical protein n=1 Tax=Thermoflexus sp. TaxID=1969742 RepID=UPI0035E45E3F
MRWRWWLVPLLLLTLLTGAFGLGTLGRAQAATGAAPLRGFLGHRGWGFGRGLCGQAGLEAAAKALNMTPEELSTQLWGGRTLAELADKAGVDLQKVRDAVNQACIQALKDAIEQAVRSGQLTREQADWLLQGLDRGYWGPGAGWWGFRGFWGRGWWAPKAPATPTPGGTSFPRPRFAWPGRSA